MSPFNNTLNILRCRTCGVKLSIVKKADIQHKRLNTTTEQIFIH